jgi:hypothetical protein
MKIHSAMRPKQNANELKRSISVHSPQNLSSGPDEVIELSQQKHGES